MNFRLVAFSKMALYGSVGMAGLNGNMRLKYYSRALNAEGTLHILLVSPSQAYLDQIAHSISITREVQRTKRSYNLKVHTCKNILDVLECVPSEFYVDFIVFLLDAHLGNCLHEVESNIQWLDSSFTKEKICLVNLDFNHSKAIVSPVEIWDYVRQNQFNLINGKTKDQNNMFAMSKRILTLAEACCGILNGIPMVNVV